MKSIRPRLPSLMTKLRLHEGEVESTVFAARCLWFVFEFVFEFRDEVNLRARERFAVGVDPATGEGDFLTFFNASRVSVRRRVVCRLLSILASDFRAKVAGSQ